MALPPHSPLILVQAQLRGLMLAVRPSVVALKTFFSAPENEEFEKCSRAGTGVLVDGNLILTSAHVVGTLSTVPGSVTSSAVKNCLIGKTVAVTAENKVLKTKLLAVDFSGDVAVLEVEGHEEADLPPPIAVARSVASKESPLLVITRHQGCDGCGFVKMKNRWTEDNSPRSDWPYVLPDGHEWAKYGGAPDNDIRIIPGSVWFSLEQKVVGIVSRAVGDELEDSSGGFAVPPPRLRSVLEYARKKAADDSIVLDRWIGDVSFSDYEDAEEIERFQNVPVGFVMTMYLPFEMQMLFGNMAIY